MHNILFQYFRSIVTEIKYCALSWNLKSIITKMHGQQHIKTILVVNTSHILYNDMVVFDSLQHWSLRYCMRWQWWLVVHHMLLF